MSQSENLSCQGNPHARWRPWLPRSFQTADILSQCRRIGQGFLSRPEPPSHGGSLSQRRIVAEAKQSGDQQNAHEDNRGDHQTHQPGRNGWFVVHRHLVSETSEPGWQGRSSTRSGVVTHAPRLVVCRSIDAAVSPSHSGLLARTQNEDAPVGALRTRTQSSGVEGRRDRVAIWATDH